MSQNPYDVRALALEIIKAVNWIKERLPANTTIIINFGENHYTPSQIMGQLALLQELKRGQHQFSFGYELAHNLLQERQSWLPRWPRLIQHSIPTRRDLSFYVDESFNGNINTANPLSTASLFQYCLDEGISVHFNDTASIEHNGRHYIDRSDKFTSKIIQQFQELYPNEYVGENVDVHSSLGMAVRNHAIVQRTIAHLRQAASEIYVQQCGFFHLLGARKCDVFPEGLKKSMSLSALYQKEGCVVINIIPDDTYILELPIDALTNMSTKITAINMAQESTQQYPERSILRVINDATSNLKLPQAAL